jgi:hypothetical protein
MISPPLNAMRGISAQRISTQRFIFIYRTASLRITTHRIATRRNDFPARRSTALRATPPGIATQRFIHFPAAHCDSTRHAAAPRNATIL